MSASTRYSLASDYAVLVAGNLRFYYERRVNK